MLTINNLKNVASGYAAVDYKDHIEKSSEHLAK